MSRGRRRRHSALHTLRYATLCCTLCDGRPSLSLYTLTLYIHTLYTLTLYTLTLYTHTL
jgi:hypothetical protein